MISRLLFLLERGEGEVLVAFPNEMNPPPDEDADDEMVLEEEDKPVAAAVEWDAAAAAASEAILAWISIEGCLWCWRLNVDIACCSTDVVAVTIGFIDAACCCCCVTIWPEMTTVSLLLLAAESLTWIPFLDFSSRMTDFFLSSTTSWGGLLLKLTVFLIGAAGGGGGGGLLSSLQSGGWRCLRRARERVSFSSDWRRLLTWTGNAPPGKLCRESRLLTAPEGGGKKSNFVGSGRCSCTWDWNVPIDTLTPLLEDPPTTGATAAEGVFLFLKRMLLLASISSLLCPSIVDDELFLLDRLPLSLSTG